MSLVSLVSASSRFLVSPESLFFFASPESRFRFPPPVAVAGSRFAPPVTESFSVSSFPASSRLGALLTATCMRYFSSPLVSFEESFVSVGDSFASVGVSMRPSGSPLASISFFSSPASSSFSPSPALASSATNAYASAATARGDFASGGANTNASDPSPTRSMRSASDGLVVCWPVAPAPFGRPGFPETPPPGVFAPPLLRTPCTRSARPSPPPPALIFSARSSALFAAFISRPAVVVGLGFNASSRTCAIFRKSPIPATAVSAASRFSCASKYAAAMTSSGVIKTAADGFRAAVSDAPVFGGLPGVFPELPGVLPGVFLGPCPDPAPTPSSDFTLGKVIPALCSELTIVESADRSAPRAKPRFWRTNSESLSTPSTPAMTCGSIFPSESNAAAGKPGWIAASADATSSSASNAYDT